MRYLILLLLLTSCSEQSKGLSAKDIAMARCICERDKKELSHVTRSANHYITFSCLGGEDYMHYDKTYTEGCSK